MPRVSGLISSLTNMLTRLTVRAETFEQAAIFLKKDKKIFTKPILRKKINIISGPGKEKYVQMLGTYIALS